MASFTTENTVFDNLIAGTEPLVLGTETLLSGENVVRGAVLGMVTASKKLKLSASAASDGSQNPVYIARDDVDASLSDKPIVVYKKGEFNQAALTFGAGYTAASTKYVLEARNIYLRAVQTY